jgi:hypothetical protein
MNYFLFSFSFVSILFLLACESNKLDITDASASKITATSITGQWQVDKVMHGWTGKIVGAETLPNQEFYQFNADSSFRKFTSEGVETTGTYSLSQNKEGNYDIALTFIAETDPGKVALQFSCGGTLVLQLSQEEGLTESNLPCDGPKKYYRRLEEDK